MTVITGKKHLPLRPKGIALWLIYHTPLTFEQIADFCGMHILEIQAMADGESLAGMVPVDPVIANQITQEELQRCIDDPSAKLRIVNDAIVQEIKNKKSKYTPIARRQDKPDAIAWFLRNYPSVPDSAITKILGTTKTMVLSIKNRSHWNIRNIKPRDPVLLGICTQRELDELLAKFVESAPVSVSNT